MFEHRNWAKRLCVAGTRSGAIARRIVHVRQLQKLFRFACTAAIVAAVT
ncbi:MULTISPECIES: hypothetical protein [unclassified Paraburkholderia]|nr:MULTISPECIES: hypothetical protein [unclassified Paraburkholderia]